MMKKIVFTTLLILSLFLSGNVTAQVSHEIAFINSKEILDALPEKEQATAKLKDLNDKYKAELTSMENEYNKKYSDFISYQISMADNIRLRRMQALYELEKSIKDFMKLAQEDIESQERELLIPLRQRVKDAIYQVGVEQGYVCIYDLANPTIVFVTPNAVDITPLVKKKLYIK